ncbi:MAG: ATP-binding cassette domain-containing protein [Bacteroidales bacterium]|nr:ATP-binding cassette domain-containing protein [Bacteroidales bacterium]
MKVSLDKLGKRFNNQWIFRGLSKDLIEGERYVILGGNGSGKSTLLQTIAGYRVPSEGSISFHDNDKLIAADQQYRYISIASPYLSLIEEFDIDELFEFHFGLKPIIPDLDVKGFKELLGLQNINKKPIRQYSSGMKQRLRLALAFFSDTQMLMLDEPCSNLDAQGVEWYRRLLDSVSKNRLVIICSNHQENEYEPCSNSIEISFYKPAATLKSR